MEPGQVNLSPWTPNFFFFSIQDGHTGKLLACTVAVSPCFVASLQQRAPDELILVVINFCSPVFLMTIHPLVIFTSIWGQSISHRFQHQFKLNHNVRY